MHWVRMMFVRIIKSHFREASLVLLGSAVLVSPPVLGASVRIVPDAAFQVRAAPEGAIDLFYLLALANQGDALMLEDDRAVTLSEGQGAEVLVFDLGEADMPAREV